MSILLEMNWNHFLFGEENAGFVFVVALRTFCMFLIILVGLRLMGKSSVSQLSIFELGIIIGLGSAAGDPMFYKEVGIVFAAIVFVVVIAMYHILKFILNKNDRLDRFIEGEPIDIVLNGEMIFKNFDREPLTRNELFAQLRSYNISQLGQIKQAILEESGKVNIFYFADEEVKYGLPILPQAIKHPIDFIHESGIYACRHCSCTTTLQPAETKKCVVCGKIEWVKASNDRRIR